MQIVRQFKIVGIIVAVLWTALLSVLLSVSLEDHRLSVESFAKSEADVLIHHMVAARSWNASHGGVYAEITDLAPPNPYLEGIVDERDITTPSGRHLTLVNPAYMTRLINEQFNKQSDDRVAHLTSLNPLRPENQADTWETKALKAFAQGATEAEEISDVDGKPFMRLMRPLTVEAACLKCHASQGYQVGDIRGGITASIPYEKHAQYLTILNRGEILTYGIIWLLGLIGIGFAILRFSTKEKTLIESQKDVMILSASVEQANEAILITDKKGIIEYVNPAFEALTGYLTKEVVGETTNLLRSPFHDAKFYEDIWNRVVSGLSWQGRVINKKKDGNHYPAMLSISPIKNEKGVIMHFVGSQQDLSEYEDLEEQFHQAQKMEALGTLVGGIAHDFNNSLAGITGNLYLAKKAIATHPEAVKRLETVEELSFSAAGMIKQLLAFARKDVKSMNPLAIASFLKEAIKIQQVSIPESITLTYDIEESEMQVRGDINQLQQVIMNLMNNARDAVDGAESPMISISLSSFTADSAFKQNHVGIEASDFACISVRDNGVGMSEKVLAKIFDPFFTTKVAGKGTGLGLAMIHGAVESHGGVVEVESAVGSGSILKVYLPTLEFKEHVIESSATDEILEGKGESILLVDDDASVVEAEKAVLENLGYKVLVAHDGEEAVEIYISNSERIDLILMDVVMPKMNGVEAAALIRETYPDLKVVYATGYDRSSSLHGKDFMANEVAISKPFTVGKISRVVRELLDN